MKVKPSKDHIGRRVEYDGYDATVIGVDKFNDYLIQYDDKRCGFLYSELHASAGGVEGQDGYGWVLNDETYTLLEDTKGPVEKKLEAYFDGENDLAEAINEGMEKQYATVHELDTMDAIPYEELPREILIQIINHYRERK